MSLFYEGVNDTSGIYTKIERDPKTGAAVILRRQDIRPLFEFNRNLALATDRHAARARRLRGNSGMIQVASIPAIVWARLVRLGIARDPKALKRWLSRRDSRAFRVDDGRKLA